MGLEGKRKKGKMGREGKRKQGRVQGREKGRVYGRGKGKGAKGKGREKLEEGKEKTTPKKKFKYQKCLKKLKGTLKLKFFRSPIRSIIILKSKELTSKGFARVS